MKPGVVTHSRSALSQMAEAEGAYFEGSLGYTERLLSPSKLVAATKKKKKKKSN